MTPWETGTLLVSLLGAGLASSFHCTTMCGPLLIAFSKWTQQGQENAASGWWLYHLGRLWTYALLGFVAGWLGLELRTLAALAAWHQPLAFFLGALVLGAGLAALGWLPGIHLDLGLSKSGALSCISQVSRGRPWLKALAQSPRASARLFLGIIMGFLPCAMVYGAALVAATLPNPLWSAIGMLSFGFGTLPSLTAVLLGARFAPRWLRAQGPRLTAFLWIAIGVVILWRALSLDPDASSHLGHHS